VRVRACAPWDSYDQLGAGKRGDWDAGAAAGQTECLSLAAGGIYIAHAYIHCHQWISILLSSSGE